MDKTTIGDRMKDYESSTESRIIARLPVIIRLDGRSFSKFTKGMQKPFDTNFSEAMIEVTKYLVEQTNAKIGYTQSDEITLVLYSDNIENGTILFDGRVQKIASNFASMASTKFLMEMLKRFPDKIANSKTLPSFDARVFPVPSKTEAANNLVWRCQDASKNSVAMLAQFNFSHKSLQGLNCQDMQNKLLKEKNIDWNDLTSHQKQGSFVRRENVELTLDEEKLSKIPADKRPENGTVIRSKITLIDMPNFLQVKNKNEVIFDNATPTY